MIAPLGLKAQVVAFDRQLCVAYYEAISALLGPGEEATVVMNSATPALPCFEQKHFCTSKRWPPTLAPRSVAARGEFNQANASLTMVLPNLFGYFVIPFTVKDVSKSDMELEIFLNEEAAGSACCGSACC